MSFNDLNQYTASHKVWDHVGNILPDIELSEGERPAVKFQPASWLPVQFRDKYYEEYYVVMPGKLVALDPDGCVMPAQYGLTSGTVSYVQADIDAGVIDIATGLPVTTVKTVTFTQLTGVRQAGWTRANAGVTATATSGFMGRFGVSDTAGYPGAFVDGTRKPPIGVAPYGFFQWAGGDGSNPANLRKHNHMLQSQVAVLCDYVIRLPYVPAQVTTEDIRGAAGTAYQTPTGTALTVGTTNWHTRAAAAASAGGRYNATTGSVPVLSTYPVIALALNKVGMATQTPRTALAMACAAGGDVSTILVNERTSLSAVRAAGDYFVDYPASVLFIYSADGATAPAALSGCTTPTLTYYEYEDSDAAGTLSRFACVCGAALQPGDLLVAGANSNFVKWAGSELQDQVMGQVLAIVDDYDEGLSKVRTAFNPGIGTDSSGSMANGVLGTAALNLGQLDQMPGTATGGYGDLTTYAGAVKYVIINLISR